MLLSNWGFQFALNCFALSANTLGPSTHPRGFTWLALRRTRTGQDFPRLPVPHRARLQTRALETWAATPRGASRGLGVLELLSQLNQPNRKIPWGITQSCLGLWSIRTSSPAQSLFLAGSLGVSSQMSLLQESCSNFTTWGRSPLVIFYLNPCNPLFVPSPGNSHSL